MAHRRVKFEDAEWDVWDVRPEVRTHRLGSDLEKGWLCFQNGPERRRLHPIPDGWDGLDDRHLQELFERANPVAPAKAAPANDVDDAFQAILTPRDKRRSD